MLTPVNTLNGFSVVPDNGGGAGMNVVANPSINSIVAGSQACTISGGGITGSPNKIIGITAYSWIAGGYDNVCESTGIGVFGLGGAHQRIYGGAGTNHASILSGANNWIGNGGRVVIAGGERNTANADDSTIAGGADNVITSTGIGAAVFGGSANIAHGNTSTISGATNVAAGSASVAMGSANKVFSSYGAVFGAGNQVGNGTVLTDGAITAASGVLTSASNPFTSGMVGMTVVVLGAGQNAVTNKTTNIVCTGMPLVTTIATCSSAGSVTLTDAAVCTVSGAKVVLVGSATDQTATWGQFGFVAGDANNIGTTATARFGGVWGFGNSVQSEYSTASGRSNVTTRDHTFVGGYGALGDHFAAWVRSPGVFSANGDNQTEMIQPWCIVTTTGATTLKCDGSVWTITLPNSSSVYFKGEVIARKVGTALTNVFHIEGIVTTDGSATTVLQWSKVDQLWMGVATGLLTISVSSGVLTLTFTDASLSAYSYYVGSKILLTRVVG